MSRLGYTLTAPWRLAKAVRAQGAGPVYAFVVLTLRRHGPANALQLAFADRRRRDQAAEDDLARPAAADAAGRRRGPADLDEDYGLTRQAWAQWAPIVGALAPSADPQDEAFADADVRFVIRGGERDGPAAARTRAAIAALGAELAPADAAAIPPGTWVVFLRAGDLPRRDFARELARAAQGGVAEVASFDAWRIERERVFPMLWPGANPTLLQAADYLFGRVALRGDALAGVDLAGADPRQVVLDWVAAQDPLQARGRWRHVARPVLELAIEAAEIEAERGRAAARALAEPRAPAAPPASVIICTRDKGHLTRQLVRSLLGLPPGQIGEIVIVANGTAKPHALATLDALEREARVTVLRRDEPFNFSRLCNAGVRASRGAGPLLFLNDDIAPVSEDWLARLLGRLDAPQVGAVGPLLLYPDERVQHAGMFLGFDGRAGHTLRAAALPEEDYLFTASAPREVSCLTGAVLLVRREAFEALNGFDEQLAASLQDVDLGLRLRGGGWLNVFDPTAVLLHMESASIRSLETSSRFQRQREAEYGRFASRWGDALSRDPLHPAGLDPQDETLHRLHGAGGERPKTEKPGARRTTPERSSDLDLAHGH